jgi:hypothetical protein
MEEDLKGRTGQLKDHVSEYAKTTIDLVKAKATKGASNAAAGTAIGFAAFLLTIFFLAFFFTGVAWWLAYVFNSAALGFFSVAGFFLLLLILIFALRKKVIIPAIRNAIISKVYEQQSN